MTKVALVSLPKQDLLRPPGALPILAAICEEAHCEYGIFDFNLWLNQQVDANTWTSIDDNWNNLNPFKYRSEPYYQTFLIKLNEFIDTIINNTPSLVAISVFSDYSAYCAVEFIDELNRRPERNKFKIVIGGSGISATMPQFHYKKLGQALLDLGKINYYIFGEGEATFREILNGNDSYPGINNFDAKQIVDLDRYPFPSYKKINPRDYRYIDKPEVMVTGSRGCVRKCTYCDVAKYWPKYRYRSGESVANELYYYYKELGITNFEFSDSLINGSLKMFRELNQTIIKHQQQDPNFKINYKGQFICRPGHQMREEDYKNMKLAGCDYIYVGIESFSDKVRYDMIKKFNNKDLELHLKMCGKYGIKNSFLMIIGYPTETIEDHQINIDMLKKYQKYAQAGIISIIEFGQTTGILADTPLFHMKDQLNIVDEFEIGYASPSNWVSLNNPTLTLKERIRRWTELVTVAAELGYLMPRIQDRIMTFIDLLEYTKDKKPIFNLNIK